ncbi:IucA/IucC family protein [Lihuaxuella thermophila]|uniref:Siderophore synthetase component n=1 Tax=Lihuaxuella thermophila TaxID=1173111 RepID=A0A1H8DDZ5_9BACL|nr:IucA/IucC family protein [Lihuaxuella thermophila]SEN05335.1 Siderophore synthetase component [Lihuaxuella thermophila]
MNISAETRMDRGARLQEARKTAEEKVLTDLMNALLYENFLDLRDRGVIVQDEETAKESTGLPLAEHECLFSYRLNSSRSLSFRVYRDARFGSYRVSRLPVLMIEQRGNRKSVRPIQAVEVMRLLAEERLDAFPNLNGFCEELKLSVEQTALSLQVPIQVKAKGATVDLTEAERFAALRDRPFHPTSRVKNGWDASEYQRYSSEFGCSFGLDWAAVWKEYVRQGAGMDDLPQRLLSEDEHALLLRSLEEKGLSLDDYTWMPVHPWQMKNVISTVFRKELAEQIIVPVVADLGTFTPSSSVRSLIPVHNPTVHVKVSIGIYSLGALRIMPPRYLENGVKGQKIIEYIKSREPELTDRLIVACEEKWSAFTDPKEDPFADKPGHLACLLRQYPAEIQEADAVLPMSALSVYPMQGKSPLIELLLQQGDEEGRQLFREICKQFIETAVLFAKYGVLPELHGQNVVLLFQHGKLRQLLLRDHDTVRIYPTWMKRSGVPEVPYTVKPNTRNTLILESAEEFLAYLQTLAIQVNLASILEAFVKGNYLTEDEGWRMIRESIEGAIRNYVPADLQAGMTKILLEAEEWPVKQIIRPLLCRVGSGGGSMPSGQGKIVNPLRWE